MAVQQLEEQWIPSACNMCYNGCSIMVRVINGVVVKIEGNPESPIGNGRLCPKGLSGIMTLYDPNRLDKPLRRTNPQKGIGIDPGWEEISWVEALDLIGHKLGQVRAEDPRQLFFQATTTCANTLPIIEAFMPAYGSPNRFSAGGGVHCGNGAHFMGGIMHASWSIVPDFEYCNYAIYFGCSKGHAAGHVANANAQKASDARNRGMKLVVVDPMCNFAASKSMEWVPIRVGTDAVLALAMVNILINELNIIDRDYLQRFTNAPYLIKSDGHYLRHPQTEKPLVWDSNLQMALQYDEVSNSSLALEGNYLIEGNACVPAFKLLKEHVSRYTLTMAAEITGIPAQTVQRMAAEFGLNAQIGSTIVIDGKELPYRPVSAIYFRGAQGHKNSLYNCMAIELLNQVVGASDVVGGTLGFCPVSHGYPDTGEPHYSPSPGPDGLMVTGAWVALHKPYPLHEPAPPQSMGLSELFPAGRSSAFVVSSDQEEMWSKCQLPYRPKLMLNFGANSMMSVGNPQTIAQALAKYDFIVSFDIFRNEFSDFADILLPDTSYLERLDAGPNYPAIFNHPAGLGEWAWPIRQPVVQPVEQRRSFSTVLYELADRAGFLPELNTMLNLVFRLKPQLQLDPDSKYSWEEICDRRLKSYFGERHDLDWFKANGIIKWPKKVEEVYWRPFVPVRVPIYYEFLLSAGEKAKTVAEQLGVELDYSRYKPLPDWFPCNSHQTGQPYDLFAFYYRDVLHTNSFTMENPWLDEASQMSPFTYKVSINRRTAAAKRLKDGDTVSIVGSNGQKIKGELKLSDGIHPECLGIAACAGHWSPYLPIAKGKGSFFNQLLDVDWEHMDHTNLNLDLCVKVFIEKD